MTLRRKFILALVGMVVFMAVIAGGISLFSFNKLLDRSVSYIQQGLATQWEIALISYYEKNGSWEGVQSQIQTMLHDPDSKGSPPRGNLRIWIFDTAYKATAGAEPEIGKSIADIPNGAEIRSKLVPLQVNSQTIGYFFLEDNFLTRSDFFSRTLVSSIMRAMLISMFVTLLVALLLGIILTRRMTEPLKQLTQAVTSVGQGQLSIRINPEEKGGGDIKALTEAFNEMTVKLAQYEEIRSNMVADIAHELRTPLTVISGKLESIQEGVAAASPETILPIQDEVIRMTRLVRDLQQLTLAEAGKLPLYIQEIDIRNMILRILDHFAIALEEKNLRIEITGESLPVYGDPDRLTQVFVNLIDNAIRHSREGGFLRINFKLEFRDKNDTEEKRLSIGITDSGEGIPETDLSRVFDRFYRVDTARDRNSGGTGLGLAIAREFIRAHGGDLTVSSRLSEGCCFTVWLRVKNNINS
ncbi:two-component sensor histidine kinase [Dehalobacter sp. 12DCB1]|uniref:sensor histidine kinase n=1 Tax=Dehalobacter sp. 12DCB1 TaxID=2070364 RepID=UPI001046AED1|nr:ATP-binding protein [Dehalobacter sp. 12DCB1]TCX56389.1 two-component sensor histidine kinase [Dehalobacter sp. 12DCB1]